MTRSIVLGGILVLGLHPWQTAWAVSIGVNFTATNFGGGPYPILPSETAGLVPQQNWNNTSALANGLT